MATRPVDPKPVLGRVDRNGRLISADPQLEELQCDAGAKLGAPLAIPQLAAIVRVARQLQIPVSRRAVAATSEHDVDMWVRAVPDGDEVALEIGQWTPRPARGPRLTSVSGQPRSPVEACRWSLDEQLRVVSLTQAAADFLGISAAEAAGQPLTKLVRLEENEDGEMPLLQALATRSSFSGQQVRLRSDERLLVMSGEVLLGQGETFQGFEGTLHGPGDEPAAGAGQAIDAALDEVFRSPLHRIIDAADGIAGRSSGPLRDEYSDYAADISAAAHHLLSIVRSMGHEAAAARASVNLVQLVEEAVGLTETAANERGIAVAVEPVERFNARGDARPVMQILVNLVGNAIRHSPEGAAVTVSFEKSGAKSIVHVADDGRGIDPADQERIFGRFERGSDAGQGSGLGLAIARRLARSLDGDIELLSEPGVGSRFSLVLPSA